MFKIIKLSKHNKTQFNNPNWELNKNKSIILSILIKLNKFKLNTFLFKDLFSPQRQSTTMTFIAYLNSEDMLDTNKLGTNLSNCSVILMKNGFLEFNINNIKLTIISKSVLTLSHSWWKSTLKLTIMEILKKPPFWKLMKEYSTEKITNNISTLGMKLRNLTHTKPLKKQTSIFFLNSHIWDSIR